MLKMWRLPEIVHSGHIFRFERNNQQDIEARYMNLATGCILLWHVVPLFGNDSEISNYTTAVAK
jgi:hypothetical protein